ncbi:MAG: hypothetical protein C0429_09695 [Sphingopyxis sp.]|nr:hypothetical protein [Sphingopyxis sp.]
MLADHLRHTVTISRSTVTGNKTTYAVAGEILAHIQPIDDSFTTGQMGRSSKAYRLFSTSEVRIGDRLEDQDGEKYECTGVKHHTFRAKSHYEATLRGV